MASVLNDAKQQDDIAYISPTRGKKAILRKCKCGREYAPKPKRDRWLCPDCTMLYYRSWRLGRKNVTPLAKLEPAKFTHNVQERIDRTLKRICGENGHVNTASMLYSLETARRSFLDVAVDLRAVFALFKRHEETWRMSEFQDMIAEQCEALPAVAPIEAELEWIAGHLHQSTPDFASAPSVGAANMWIDVRTQDSFRQDFWKMLWRTRQPGLQRSKDSPFEADRTDVQGEQNRQYDVELRDRLCPAVEK